MNNPWDEMRAALSAARAAQDAADNAANAMADLLDGRLRKLSPSRLKKLKAQLRDFNMHTERWKAQS